MHLPSNEQKTGLEGEHLRDALLIVRNHNGLIAKRRSNRDAIRALQRACMIAIDVVGIFEDVACQDCYHICAPVNYAGGCQL